MVEQAGARIRVVIADDHELMRDGLRRLIETEPDLHVVGEAHNGTSAVDAVTTLSPDVLLLDMSMPEAGGLGALRRLDVVAPQTRVLLVSAGISDADLQEALRYGARGLVLKTAATELLLKAIRAVASGEHWISRQVVNELARAVADMREQRPTARNGKDLTRREEEVLALAAAGLPNKDIAAKLSVSENTVKHHLTKVFEKSGCATRVELVRYAIDRGLATVARPPVQ